MGGILTKGVSLTVSEKSFLQPNEGFQIAGSFRLEITVFL